MRCPAAENSAGPSGKASVFAKKEGGDFCRVKWIAWRRYAWRWTASSLISERSLYLYRLRLLLCTFFQPRYERPRRREALAESSSAIASKIEVSIPGHVPDPGHSCCLSLQLRIFKLATWSTCMYLAHVLRERLLAGYELYFCQVNFYPANKSWSIFFSQDVYAYICLFYWKFKYRFLKAETIRIRTSRERENTWTFICDTKNLSRGNTSTVSQKNKLSIPKINFQLFSSHSFILKVRVFVLRVRTIYKEKIYTMRKKIFVLWNIKSHVPAWRYQLCFSKIVYIPQI